jgi:aryl-alcohol dehydrogenase-like predicted oxidoreductase
MEKRVLGKTGQSLSVIGFGGIVVMNTSTQEASTFVSRAINEEGVNYFDVAPSYGNAEECLGPALKPYRKDVFLACKTGKHTAKSAKEELNRSLKHLQTDHFDLYQFHSVPSIKAVEQIFAPDGAMETFLAAQQAGKIRWIGFSCHHEEVALALLDRFNFDTVLFPLNWVTWYTGHFGPRLLDKALAQEKGILALKALAKRPWEKEEHHRWDKTWYSPVDTYEEALAALRFTLSLPVTAAVSPGHAELLWWACDAARNFTPITSAEAEILAQRAATIKPIFKS